MDNNVRMLDISGSGPSGPRFWEPVIVSRQAIDREIERLAAAPRPANGRRATRIVHPQASAPSNGFAPGIDVTLSVLLPGESTEPLRHNSSQVSLCLRGTGHVEIGDRSFDVEHYDAWNTPSMRAYRYTGRGGEPFVRLTYSNGALLETMGVHRVEAVTDLVDTKPAVSMTRSEAFQKAKALAQTFELGSDGAYLMPYEHLIDPDVAVNRPLLWPWKLVSQHIGKLPKLGEAYTGRRVYCLYNPATGRTNGTTHSFFATIGVLPPGANDALHRHSSAAINYYMDGEGFSTVEDRHYEWKTGDLMLSAPGWAAHGHGSRETGAVGFTVQDHPLQIATESLIWQERLDGPVLLLGAEEGFSTNIGELALSDA